VKLLDGIGGIRVVFIRGEYDLMWARMSKREGHFMKPAMLRSQFEILEEPEGALVVDASMTVADMLVKIKEDFDS
jgi:gluconokinase